MQGEHLLQLRLEGHISFLSGPVLFERWYVYIYRYTIKCLLNGTRCIYILACLLGHLVKPCYADRLKVRHFSHYCIFNLYSVYLPHYSVLQPSSPQWVWDPWSKLTLCFNIFLSPIYIGFSWLNLFWVICFFPVQCNSSANCDWFTTYAEHGWETSKLTIFVVMLGFHTHARWWCRASSCKEKDVPFQ